MERDQHAARVRAHFLPLLEAHGSSSLAVGYKHAGNHIARYQILLGIDDVAEASILDVGCGVGHFAKWLSEHGYRGDYKGVDLMPEMVDRAREQNPGKAFEVCDITQAPANLSADFVMASGIFHMGDAALMKEMLTAMFARCRIGVAFNSLSAWDGVDEQGDFYCADPLEIIDFCRTLTPNIIFRHDYLPHDFTVFLYK